MTKKINLELIETYLLSVAVEVESDSQKQKSIIEKLMKCIETECGNIYNEEKIENDLRKYNDLPQLYRRCYYNFDHSISGKIYLQNEKYKNAFLPIQKLGRGGFGSVYKVRDKIDNQLYAVKKIKLNIGNCIGSTIDQIQEKINESQIWAKLKNEFCVDYKTSWIEEHAKDHIPVVYIQTELCLMNLRDGMEKIHKELKYSKDSINSRGLFIASQLFYEMCAGVNYLHSRKPPIIHRDLKPENILITDGKNANFIKICDFGLATGHARKGDFSEEMFNIKVDHSSKHGTRNYMAPEMIDEKRVYDTTADLFSIGVIMGELFCIDSDVFNYGKGRKNICCDKNEVIKYMRENDVKNNLNELFAQVVTKYLRLIHPDTSTRKDMPNEITNEMIPFKKIKYNEDMAQYCYTLFSSKTKPNIDSLSDYILRKKISKNYGVN